MTNNEFTSAVINEKQALKSFALSLTRNMEDAEDLLQDTFLKAIRYKEKYTEETNLKAWLFTIMKNTFINNYRRAVKAKEIIGEKTDLAMAQAYSKIGTNDAEGNMLAKDILKAIDGLEEAYKRPFTRYYNGYKYQEIAEEMSLPIGTIKSRIFIARKMLIGKLKSFTNR